MNLPGVLHLGSRYLARNRTKTCLLVAAFTLVWLLPSGIALLVRQFESHLRARAAETPLLLGQAGSPLELVFNGLYFTKPGIATLTYGEALKAGENGEALVVPIHARFSAQQYRIVGTTLDYFDLRKLVIAEGRDLVTYGECVLGAEVANAAGIGPGDHLISTPETLFDIAGVYPLKMPVVGVLAATGTADDRAIFVDLHTAWIIQGLGHGHADAEKLGPEALLPGNTGDTAARLNASVPQYQEVTEENIDDFHFHGSEDDFPITAAIVVPSNAKSQALLKGRHTTPGGLQLISPTEEMDELFATVFSVQDLVLGLLLGIGVATVSIGALVFLLSNRLRRDEFRHLRHLGADPPTLRALVGFEAIFVLLASLACALGGLGVITWMGPILVRHWTG